MMRSLSQSQILWVGQITSTPRQKRLTLSSETQMDAPIDLTGEITREGKYACAHGGFADVWKGIWSNARGAHVMRAILCTACPPDSSLSLQAVAIKVLRAPMDDPAKQLKLQKVCSTTTFPTLSAAVHAFFLCLEASSRAVRLAALETRKRSRATRHYIGLWTLS